MIWWFVLFVGVACLILWSITIICSSWITGSEEASTLDSVPSNDTSDLCVLAPPRWIMKCINLACNTSRRPFIVDQMHASACSIRSSGSFSFEEGLDPSLFPVPFRLHGRYVFSDQATGAYQVSLPPGLLEIDTAVVASTVSHLKAITTSVAAYCLIIEDTTFLSMTNLIDGFDLDTIVGDAPTDWGMLQISCCGHQMPAYTPWTVAHPSGSTCAYIIRKECADLFRTHLVLPDGTLHLNQPLSGHKGILPSTEYFLHGFVNTSTPFRAYILPVVSCYIVPGTHSSRRLNMQSDIAAQVSSRYMVTINSASVPGSRVDASLCVPCHYGHLACLKVLLLSLHLQERMVDEIVISFSSVPPQIEVMHLCAILQPLVPDCTLHVCVSHCVLHAGTNRNICMEKSRHDILIFMDADDLMHSNRIRIVYEIMINNPNLASLLHSYARPSKHASRSVEDVVYSEVKGIELYDSVRDWSGSTSTAQTSSAFDIVHGHPVVRRSRLQPYDIVYTDVRRGEDVLFNQTILKALGRSDDTMMVISTPLTIYLQENSSTAFTSNEP